MASAGPRLEIVASRDFVGWLEEQRVALAITTYQIGKLFLIGHGSDGRLSIFERTFDRAMGLWSDGRVLWLSTKYQLWRLQDSLDPGRLHQGYDRVYVPRVGYTTGDLDVHDVAVDREGRVVFVATLFGCLATVSETHSFVPLWKPSWITALVPEDRCHLNGLALEDGIPAYVTATSRSDVVDGWREHRRDGGVIVDVRNDAVVAEGLSMPHSPRVDKGRLWVLEAGSGQLGWVDRARGVFEPLTFCPGFGRGLGFVGDYAVVGTSKARKNHALRELPLDEALGARQTEPRCALHVVDLRDGSIRHWIRFEGIVEELYDVAILPAVKKPMAIGFRTDEIERVVSIGSPGKI